MEARMSSNLVQHRAEPSVWDATARTECDVERWAAGLAAGALVATGIMTGIRRRGPAGLLMVVAGGAIAWWAATETEVRKQRRARIIAAVPGAKRHDDPVRSASEESFPASDPPSWTPTTGTPTKTN
jgi:hypothetical protein